MMNIMPINSRDGMTYWVEKDDNLYIERLKYGQYQKTNWLFAQTLISNWRRAIDIGSNNACNAIHYARRFEIVECFEPTKLAQVLWQNTVRDNQIQNVKLYPVALGSDEFTTEIITHPRNGGHNHIRPQKSETKKVCETVDVKTLDSFNFNQVDFIKIDVEGYEYPVLQGAQKIIQQDRPTIQLEIVAAQCEKFNYTAIDMIEWIRSWDYRVMSKNHGELDGKFSIEQEHLCYKGQRLRGEMDLWFQPRERVTVREQIVNKLFEIE